MGIPSGEVGLISAPFSGMIPMHLRVVDVTLTRERTSFLLASELKISVWDRHPSLQITQVCYYWAESMNEEHDT